MMHSRGSTPLPRTVLLLAAALALVLAACGSDDAAPADDAAEEAAADEEAGDAGAADPDGDFEVAFSLFTEAAPLFRAIRTNLDDVLAEGGFGVDVTWYDNEADPGVMLENAQLMIDAQPDGIVFYPVSTATAGIGEMFNESGIPCVAVNLDIPGCPFLNIDNAALGDQTARIIGEIAIDLGWDASNTTVLLGQNAAAGEQVNDAVRFFYASIAPIMGFEEVPVEDITPSTTRISDNAIQFDGQSTLQPSFEAVSGLLPGVPADHNIILYTVNNDSTTGALRALEEAGRGDVGQLLIGGLGGDVTGLETLRDDERWVAEGDIFIDWWGQYAIAMVQSLAAGATPPEEVTALPQAVVTMDDVGQFRDLDSLEVVELPPLESSNEYLRESGFLQQVGNVEGL